jgi:hypothetical protein
MEAVVRESQWHEVRRQLQAMVHQLQQDIDFLQIEKGVLARVSPMEGVDPESRILSCECGLASPDSASFEFEITHDTLSRKPPALLQRSTAAP